MKSFPLLSRLLRFFFLTSVLVTILQKEGIAQIKKGSAVVGTASYKKTNNGKFLRTWWIAGPVKMPSTASHTMDEQEKFFKEEIAIETKLVKSKPVSPIVTKGNSYEWRSYTSVGDNINLDSVVGKADYAAVYAMAEITTDSAQDVLLGLGSDDGVKVWLNGKVIHNNWVGRGVVADADIVPVSLVKGGNTLLIKVQNMQGGWGFTARFLDKVELSNRLIAASARGSMEEIETLLKAGAAMDHKDASGLSAVNAAKLHGRDEVVRLLVQKGAIDVPLPTTEAMIDGLYSSLNGKPFPGIALLVVKDGKIVYKKGFGYADIENKIPASTDTKFRIGSITKQFIASAILKLQEEGKLQVTDKLSKFITDFPRGNEVTIHHLLTHTSGIHSFTDKEDFFSKVTSPTTTESLVNSIKKDSFDFNPGEQWRYNNSGYFLLGYIIEKLTGKQYGDYLKQTFFDPLQMTNTGVHSSTLNLTKEAKGYTKENDKYQRALNWDMTWAGGAGALYSTVEDLSKWNEAVFGGKVLSDTSLKAAFTPVLLNGGKETGSGSYGYGWGIGKYRGLQVIQHSGGLHGFLSQLARYPDEHLSVVLLTNVAPPQVEINPNTIAEFFLWDKMEKQPSYAAQPALEQDLKIYEGRYDFRNGAVMNISAEGKSLFAQLSGQGKYPIFPSSPDEFFWKVVEARMKFTRNEKGEISGAKFYQNGAELTVPKLKEETIVAVDPALYKDYAGNYDMGNNTIINVSTEDGKLFAMAVGEQKYEIFPLSESTFFLKELNARLTFVRTAGAPASKIIVEMSGQKKDAPRVNKQ